MRGECFRWRFLWGAKAGCRPRPRAGGQGSGSACAKGPCIGHIPTRHSAVPVGGAASSCAAAPDRPAPAPGSFKGTLPRPRCPCTRTSGVSRHAVPSPSSGRSSSSHRKCYPSATGLTTSFVVGKTQRAANSRNAFSYPCRGRTARTRTAPQSRSCRARLRAGMGVRGSAVQACQRW